MNLHLVIKYQFYGWNLDDKSVETMAAHVDVLNEKGACWWGRIHSIAADKIEQLKSQINENIPTYAFLYATAVPRAVNEDGNSWHLAKIKDIFIGTPNNKELIPEYYRSLELGVAFLLEDIKPLKYEIGTTPKAPGQASLRYVNIGKSPKPELLLQAGKSELLCAQTNLLQGELNSEEVVKDSSSKAMDVRDRVIELQNEVIELQKEIRILTDYKVQYQKILNTDYLFNSEKFLETWIEENIHKVADNLIIIDRQPNAKWDDGKFGRLDLLALNKDTKDLVIIEVKTRKRNKKSSYDQFLRYTTWARKNLKELETTYASYGLKPTTDLSFMIITDLVDEEMTEICKGHGITLIKVFGGLGFDKIA